MRTYYVYIVSSRSRNLYVGVTNGLVRRVFQHKTHTVPGFTARYRIGRLVHFEEGTDVRAAIARESKSRRGDEKRKLH